MRGHGQSDIERRLVELERRQQVFVSQMAEAVVCLAESQLIVAERAGIEIPDGMKNRIGSLQLMLSSLSAGQG